MAFIVHGTEGHWIRKYFGMVCEQGGKARNFPPCFLPVGRRETVKEGRAVWDVDENKKIEAYDNA